MIFVSLETDFWTAFFAWEACFFMKEEITKSDFKLMSDEEVVALAQGGKSEATEYILEKYKSLVKARVRAYFLIGADKEDLLQEGMIGLFKAIRDFSVEKQANFAAFAELCATRQIVTAIKTATRQKHTPLNNYISLNKPAYSDESERSLLDSVPYASVSDPEQIVINEEEYNITSERITENLSDFEKSVLSEYLQGKSYNEIAEVQGRSAKSIDNALQRIKRKIETNLK